MTDGADSGVRLRTVLGLLALFAVFTLSLLGVQGIFGDPLEAHIEARELAPKAPPRPSAGTAVPDKIDGLACFSCHSVVEFHKGDPDQPGTDDDGNINPKAFSHDLHVGEGLVHCHLCHAFEGHFQVSIRKATCEECH